MVLSLTRTLRTVRVHAPSATRLAVVVAPAERLDDVVHVGARRDLAGGWTAELIATDGDVYWLEVDGGPPLLDPACADLVLSPDGPRSVFRGPWPRRPKGRPLTSPPVVYELHVRGFGRTFGGCVTHLDHVAGTGANVIELMPVHPFDDTTNYWGYMPLVWGAVHRGYADEPDRAPEELAALVEAAHDRGLHVWLDVVFNHTGEGDATMPTRSLRGLDDANAYRHHPDGRYTGDSGCGNDINPADPNVRRLVLEALDRYADLGIDGFRFDLASLLTRDGGGLVSRITEWASGRGVTLIAEPWDLAAYQVGAGFPWPEWLQWNDRFRDDVRSFLRGDPGLVDAVRRRIEGSPDLFGTTNRRSVNFVTAHDGLTMHDLTIVTSDRHRSWDTGPATRLQQLKNYFAVLLLSAGTPMWVMGDEFARTQLGHDNPYDIDSELTWVDWSRADEWRELTDFVRALLRLRRRHPPGGFRFYGPREEVDVSFESRSIAWSSSGLYVMVNAWWQPLEFAVQEPGDWQVALASASPEGHHLAPRSVVVLRRTAHPSGVEAESEPVE